ncbi:hypothetical protein JMX53_01890 [Cutibacterium avidum]|uniref:hypothetical protein n=1 Tax=Cutibacterium avidum TaxID=33010 RepID=UPI00192A889C|nr:hypothetical protein [Cutibacterium avidum]QQY15374.1 hypothetical protein JMX53_01890 [Cutibacterium avidum]
MPATQIYQFDDQKAAVGSGSDKPVQKFKTGPVEVRLSPELKKALPASTKIAVDHYTVSVKSFPSGQCRVDAKISYAPGGLARLKQKGPAETNEDYYKDVVTRVLDNTVTSIGYSGSDPARDADATIVSNPPSDSALKSDTMYMTKDFSTATIVSDCTDTDDIGSHQDSKVLAYLQFVDPQHPVYVPGTDAHGFSAEAGLTAAKDNNGEMYLKGSVQEVDVSADGHWTASPSGSNS